MRVVQRDLTFLFVVALGKTERLSELRDCERHPHQLFFVQCGILYHKVIESDVLEECTLAVVHKSFNLFRIELRLCILFG